MDPTRGDFIVAERGQGANSRDPQGLCKIANMEGRQRENPGNAKVDIVLRKNGRVTTFDVTIANPAANKYIAKGSDATPEVAIRDRIKTKEEFYHPLLPPQSESNRFVVLAFEVTGRMEHTTMQLIKSMFPKSSDFAWRKFQNFLSVAIARFISDEVNHGIGHAHYPNGQNPMELPFDRFRDEDEDEHGPPPGPPQDM